MWSRALSLGAPHRACEEVSRLLSRLGVSRVVVGHTVQQGGEVSVR